MEQSDFSQPPVCIFLLLPLSASKSHIRPNRRAYLIFITHFHNMGDIHIIDDWQNEQAEWLEALEEVLESQGKSRTEELFQALRHLLARKGVANAGPALNTPYLNSIAADDQPAYPGDLALEQRIEHILRWNAQAMVLHAQDKGLALGGHIATYAACATMWEVMFNHFLRKRSADYGGDLLMI